MKKSEFLDFVREIGNFYGMEKIVNEGRFAAWYEMAGHVPAAALDHIRKRICAERDTMPRNLPKCVLDAWREWLAANPDRRANANERAHCADCNGEGLLFYREMVDDLPAHSAVAKCGRCDNWRRHVGSGVDIPFKTVVQLKDQGIDLL
jgi:hypothetical protein